MLYRIRPPGATGDLSPCCVDVGMEGDLAVYDQHNGTKRLYKVDRVFDQHVDQAAVYEDTQPLIRSVLDGELDLTGNAHVAQACWQCSNTCQLVVQHFLYWDPVFCGPLHHHILLLVGCRLQCVHLCIWPDRQR